MHDEMPFCGVGSVGVEMVRTLEGCDCVVAAESELAGEAAEAAKQEDQGAGSRLAPLEDILRLLVAKTSD